MNKTRAQHEECALVTIARARRYLQAAEDAIRAGAPSITHARTLAEAVQRLSEDTVAMLTIDLAAVKGEKAA